MRYAEIRQRCSHSPRQWHGDNHLLPCANPECEESTHGDALKVMQDNGCSVIYERRCIYIDHTVAPTVRRWDWWIAPAKAPEPSIATTRSLREAFEAVKRLCEDLGVKTRFVDAGAPGSCNCFMICGHEPGSTPACVSWNR